MGSLCSKDPLSKPPFGKTKVGAHFTPCHSISLLVTPCPKYFQIERPTKTRRTDFTGLDEQLPCRVQLLLLHTEPVFLRRVFHSPQIIFTLPHLCMAGLCQYEGFNCTRNLSSAQRWRIFSPRGGENQNLLFSKAQKCFLLLCTLRHRSTVIACHTDCYQMPSLGCHRVYSQPA